MEPAITLNAKKQPNPSTSAVTAAATTPKSVRSTCSPLNCQITQDQSGQQPSMTSPTTSSTTSQDSNSQHSQNNN